MSDHLDPDDQPGDLERGDGEPDDVEPGDLEPGALEPGDVEPGDVELIDLLGRALEAADPPPESVLAAARGSYAWLGIDVELATLTFDSLTDETVGARSTGADERQLTFTGPGVEVELLVTGTGERRLVGQVVPPGDATVVLETTDDTRDAEADSLGRFGFGAVAGGLMRLTVVAGATRVKTEWIIV